MIVFKWLRYLWAVYFLTLFCLFFLLFSPFFYILLSKRKWYPMAHRLRAVWGHIIMFLSGLWPSRTGTEHLEKGKTYIFAANHFSYLDILSMNVQVPAYFRFLAKSELGKIPLFGIFFRTIDIPVDRNSIRASHQAFVLGAQALQEGDSLGIFPEGGIRPSAPKMGSMKSGAFKLAIEQQVPIVPIAILDNWKRLPVGGYKDGGTPGRMRIVIHEPVPTEGMTLDDLSALASAVSSTIQNTFDKYNFADHEDHRRNS